MTSSVLFGYDGSPAADRAIDLARPMLSADRAIVVVVWEPSLPALTDYGTSGLGAGVPADPQTADILDNASEHNANRVAAAGVERARAAGFPDAVSIVTMDSGDVALTLADLAAEHGAAAVVVGSHGHGAFHTRLMGSTSTELMRHAPCPVVVVPRADSDV